MPCSPKTISEMLPESHTNEKCDFLKPYSFSNNLIPDVEPTHLKLFIGAQVAQRVKRWPTDLADRVRSPLEAKSSQP